MGTHDACVRGCRGRGLALGLVRVLVASWAGFWAGFVVAGGFSHDGGGDPGSVAMALAGVVLLIGLAAKTAILIVEFAKQAHEVEGRGIDEAALDAARLRVRAILMTAFSFILGVIPLVLATGAGARSRVSIGTAVMGGMLVYTVLGVFFIPVLYSVVEHAMARLRGRNAPAPPPAR